MHIERRPEQRRFWDLCPLVVWSKWLLESVPDNQQHGRRIAGVVPELSCHERFWRFFQVVCDLRRQHLRTHLGWQEHASSSLHGHTNASQCPSV
jgi:hypothetical protein